METAQISAPDMDFGTRLQAARRRLGLDLRSVAEQVPGVSMSALAKWEHNDREPGAFRLARLADFYGVDVRWLLEGATTEREKSGGPSTRQTHLVGVPATLGQIAFDFDAPREPASLEAVAA